MLYTSSKNMHIGSGLHKRLGIMDRWPPFPSPELLYAGRYDSTGCTVDIQVSDLWLLFYFFPLLGGGGGKGSINYAVDNWEKGRHTERLRGERL